MLHVSMGQAGTNCAGMSRRSAIRAGLFGATGLSLAGLLRAEATSPKPTNQPEKSVILIWLDGGPSQLETYDPKPGAPVEVRGPFGAISTKLPGVQVSELMPHTAKRLDQVSIIRSLAHGTGDHFAGGHWMTTGRFGATTANKDIKSPSMGSVITHVKGGIAPDMPPYVGLPAAQTIYLYPGYMGAAYLGNHLEPFQVNREASYLGVDDGRRVSSPPWLKNFGKERASLLSDRQSLLTQIDQFRRDLDASRMAENLDQYQQRAIEMILSGKARTAFDFDQENPRLADRYGSSPWARYTMMARRLVEAGVRFVTVDMPHWDDHSNLERGHGRKVRVVDQAVGALLDDLQDRGLLETTIVLVMGEFGRTPRINKGLPNDPVPGRDHWGAAISAMIAGGGIPRGVVVGKTNDKAEYPTDRALAPGNLLATVYHHLGIDLNLSFKDHTGRPVPILDENEPIAELI
ncbi:DUF1501 domain-containing protein [Tuwongella immobilis]|uniref:DUF1501 domain-containing protein n=1 Tax=Tuwongella immobilis TaxID=692036 RepID=A0A6C2YV49_9BACT|nr:DUF1501 domain-containing protein [Tuwongella immobilis]VIP05618.1 hypothetical protein : Uncharacterized protein OS=Singulisphaera acidiphila (strain ATCC BAA-1392 / DSM 18658 / VKM B-2454 / MOB10) GN=Sinac_3079 PE=4 SV=1: DUF1501 [Tuwongella immobilis]VTS08592.1 hypothetical protein : Uncharacterized protein OS=Singulisphaera acidiphila (strain ATCC BAA-1392 / DSM 18658 / VKM B-2454 / MOB10) GN=Sinac_3079 PE=4 SV=1: DUF1501 [Tuwongella immobilis]